MEGPTEKLFCALSLPTREQRGWGTHNHLVYAMAGVHRWRIPGASDSGRRGSRNRQFSPQAPNQIWGADISEQVYKVSGTNRNNQATVTADAK